jgi:beta-lysine 5,6-aminomutase beta subunit
MRGGEPNMGGPYSNDKKDFDKEFDIHKVRPYGDTMNDGKVQISFTLPVKNDLKAEEAAKIISSKMGLNNPDVVYRDSLDENFTFFIIYGSLTHSVNYDKIKVESVNVEVMSMKEINEYIKENIGRKINVLGATTGTDAHTVGIDAILNMKGYAGKYGLERYEMINAVNMGSQVPNEVFIKKALEMNADILLVSQTVTQKDIHIQNLTELVELLEAEGLRKDIILICGGPRINNKLAKELGYDAGFGPETTPNLVASFFIKELENRKLV